MAVPLPNCPKCEHNLSAFAGSCTALTMFEDGSFGYCSCDCYKAVHGESLIEKFVREIRDDSSDKEG